VRAAFEQTLTEIEPSIPKSVRQQIMEIIRWLCEPDPKRRGHPTDLEMYQFNLERLVSTFDKLATQAALGLLKA
jgi:hypothetical protein